MDLESPAERVDPVAVHYGEIAFYAVNDPVHLPVVTKLHTSDEAVIDVDGTLVATGAGCKQGVNIAYDGTWVR